MRAVWLCGILYHFGILSVFENEFGNHTQKMGFCIILSVFENEFGNHTHKKKKHKTTHTEKRAHDESIRVFSYIYIIWKLECSANRSEFLSVVEIFF